MEAGVKRLFSSEPLDDVLRVTPLGSGSEVGRSCVVVNLKGRNIMFDCGIHPAHSGLASLPFFDHVPDLSSIEVCLVTHFHLDHSGALPYLVNKTNFKGRVFMTHPTRPICSLLWQDFARVAKIDKINNNTKTATTSSDDEMLFSFKDCEETARRIECLAFRETITTASGIRVTAYRAGHVLGAAMFLVEVEGLRVLYTGDFSREEDRHLPSADAVPRPVHCLIIESTYGIQNHEPRLEREARFCHAVYEIVRRGGKCLLPVFALGRAQELLFILEEFWDKHVDLHAVPIFYCTPLANKVLRVFETYTAMCSDDFQAQVGNDVNPWRAFKFVTTVADAEASARVFDSERVSAAGSPCVVLAAPGMLQSGLSRDLFERWATDKANGVVLTGYSVAGTPAHDLKNTPESMLFSDGRRVAARCSTKSISFSAHSDFTQTRAFIAETGAPHVVLVHGEATLMRKLKEKLLADCPSVTCANPINTQSVDIDISRLSPALATSTSTSTSTPEGDRVRLQAVGALARRLEEHAAAGARAAWPLRVDEPLLAMKTNDGRHVLSLCRSADIKRLGPSIMNRTQSTTTPTTTTTTTPTTTTTTTSVLTHSNAGVGLKGKDLHVSRVSMNHKVNLNLSRSSLRSADRPEATEVDVDVDVDVVDLLRGHMELVFGSEEVTRKGNLILISKRISLTVENVDFSDGVASLKLSLQWWASASSDLAADACLASCFSFQALHMSS